MNLQKYRVLWLASTEPWAPHEIPQEKIVVLKAESSKVWV